MKHEKQLCKSLLHKMQNSNESQNQKEKLKPTQNKRNLFICYMNGKHAIICLNKFFKFNFLTIYAFGSFPQ